jgi:hypothetical protein
MNINFLNPNTMVENFLLLSILRRGGVRFSIATFFIRLLQYCKLKGLRIRLFFFLNLCSFFKNITRNVYCCSCWTSQDGICSFGKYWPQNKYNYTKAIIKYRFLILLSSSGLRDLSWLYEFRFLSMKPMGQERS